LSLEHNREKSTEYISSSHASDYEDQDQDEEEAVKSGVESGADTRKPISPPATSKPRRSRSRSASQHAQTAQDTNEEDREDDDVEKQEKNVTDEEDEIVDNVEVELAKVKNSSHNQRDFDIFGDLDIGTHNGRFTGVSIREMQLAENESEQALICFTANCLDRHGIRHGATHSTPRRSHAAFLPLLSQPRDVLPTRSQDISGVHCISC
jgi:hypothetical protein